MACVLTIGNFDGVHVGHQEILRRGCEAAEAAGVELVAMTFDRHPAQLLKPDKVPPALLSLQDRVRWLGRMRADRVEVIPLTHAVLAESAEAFVRRVVAEWSPTAFVEGPDFQFGHKRRGDNALLRAMGPELGFQTHVVEPQEVALANQLVAPASSSLIRWLLGHGRVQDAGICLGRPFELTAEVVKGEQRGRTIGVPTANLDLASITGQLIPANGVYAGTGVVDGNGASGTYRTAISVGVKPTFGRRQLTVEAHLFDLPEGTSLYGEALTLRFEKWVRAQMAFPSPALLVEQIHRDLEACRVLV